MGIPSLLAALVLFAAPAGDAELRARLALSAVPGVTIEIAQGEKLAPAGFCAGEKVACDGPKPGWDISWTSAPDKITPIKLAPEALAGARVLLQDVNGNPLLLARGSTLVVAMDTSGPVRRWLFFNYMLYAAGSEIAGQVPVRYGDWDHSPVPGPVSRKIYVVGTLGLWALLYALFRLARRAGKADPEAASRFFASIEAASQKANRASAGTKKEARSGWSKAGFARPLAGLMTTVGTMAFMAGGYLVLQWTLSSKVQPFPEADGLWNAPFLFLLVVALLFECGTNIAVQRYFAQHRVQEPAEALRDVQFFVWWSFAQRLAQVTLLVGFAVLFQPYLTPIAIYAPFVAIFAIKSLPSIFQIGKLLCSSLQRFDYQNLLDLAEQKILRYLMPIPCVLIGRQWGLEHPAYGEVFGAALGLAVGNGLAYLITLALGLWALKRIGVPLRSLFLVQFDASVARRQLLFGFKMAIGSEPMFLIQAVEQVAIGVVMLDFVSWQGVHGLLIGRLCLLYGFGQMFTGGSIAAFSEALSNGKRKLSQYYISRYFQFVLFFHLTLFSLLMAIGPTFIATLGPQWARAIPYLPLALGVAFFWGPVWVSDGLQQGAGKAGLYFVTMMVEQAAKFALIFLLVPFFGFGGILLAGLLSVGIKGVFGWAMNSRVIVGFKMAPWGSMLAIGAAAAANYAVWRGLLVFWTPTSDAEVLVLMCVASGLSFLVTFFVAGLAGGFDRRALDELRQAAAMVSFVGPIARVLCSAAELGARLAPFTPEPIDVAEAASLEAAELDEAAAAALHGKAEPEPAAEAKAVA